jgi:Tol biopolymer transport system component
MRTSHFFARWLVIVLVIYGCSVEVNQSPIVNTQIAIGSPVPSKVPVAWANLNLTGKLVYIAADTTIAKVGIHSLDLETGERTTIFQVPQRGWVDAAAVSPDQQTLILSYSPPMEAPNGPQGTLYSMPMDGSGSPQMLFTRENDKDLYFQPTWSPDGKYIYLAHVYYQTEVIYEIMRMAYPDGKPEKLVDHAYWPRVSEDGTRLVYVGRESETGKNQLFFAHADGTDARQVPLNDLPVPDIIDTPMLSPDNQSIIFSSPVGIKVYSPNWFDKLLGVQVGLANGSLPSDWWSVPISGGTPRQLTNIQSQSLFGVFAPDNKYIASFSLDGIFVMHLDGSELTMVVNDVGGIPGTVDWIP